MVSFDPARPDFAPYGFTCVRWNPSRMRRPDHHNEIELNLLHRGSVTYLFAGQKVEIEAGHLCAFWAAIPHQVIEYGGAQDYFVATIPLAWFLQWKLPEPFVQALLRGELLSEPRADRAPLDYGLFTQWIEDLKGDADERQRVVSLEMEARLLRFSLDLKGGRKWARTRRNAPALGLGGLTRVEQMACVIAQRYREKLTVEEIGRAVGLHPQLRDGPVPEDVWDDLAGLSDTPPCFSCATVARHDQWKSRRCGIRLGVHLNQPIQRSFPPRLRLHPERVSPAAPTQKLRGAAPRTQAQESRDDGDDHPFVARQRRTALVSHAEDEV